MARTSGMSRRIIQRIWTRTWAFGVGTVLIEPPSMDCFLDGDPRRLRQSPARSPLGSVQPDVIGAVVVADRRRLASGRSGDRSSLIRPFPGPPARLPEARRILANPPARAKPASPRAGLFRHPDYRPCQARS